MPLSTRSSGSTVPMLSCHRFGLQFLNMPAYVLLAVRRCMWRCFCDQQTTNNVSFHIVVLLPSRRLPKQDDWVKADTITLPDWQELDIYRCSMHYQAPTTHPPINETPASHGGLLVRWLPNWLKFSSRIACWGTSRRSCSVLPFCIVGPQLGLPPHSTSTWHLHKRRVLAALSAMTILSAIGLSWFGINWVTFSNCSSRH